MDSKSIETLQRARVRIATTPAQATMAAQAMDAPQVVAAKASEHRQARLVRARIVAASFAQTIASADAGNKVH